MTDGPRHSDTPPPTWNVLRVTTAIAVIVLLIFAARLGYYLGMSLVFNYFGVN